MFFSQAWEQLSEPLLFVLGFWWLWLPPAVFMFFWPRWLRYARLWYYWVRSPSWVVIEIRIPKEILKTPKAAEQIFSGVWNVITKGNLYEQLWWGRWIDYMSFELLGTAGETHFLVCLPEGYRQMVEGYVFGEYPEAEITQVEDYFRQLPEEMPAEGWRIQGTELQFTRPDPYPIRTYHQFEDPTEERRIDPMSHFAELFGKLQQGEYVIFQLVVRPEDGSWMRGARKHVEKLIGKVPPTVPEAPEVKETRTWWETLGAHARQLFFGGELPLPAEEERETPNKVGESKMLHLSPGERATVEGIELKMNKVAMEVNLRMMYAAPENLFRLHAKSVVSGMFGALGTFQIADSNGFRPNNATRTWVDYFRKRRQPRRQKRLWHEMRKRLLVDNLFSNFFSGKNFGRPSGVLIMNVEELASIWHFPIAGVTAPLLPRIEAKKGEPPVGLPVG